MSRSQTVMSGSDVIRQVGTAILWSLGALVVAIAMSFAANMLFFDFLDSVMDPFSGGGVVPAAITLIGTSLLVGGSIGLVIGTRVPRGRKWVAAAVAVFYLSLVPVGMVLDPDLGPFWSVFGLAVFIGSATGIAWWFEKREGKAHRQLDVGDAAP